MMRKIILLLSLLILFGCQDNNSSSKEKELKKEKSVGSILDKEYIRTQVCNEEYVKSDFEKYYKFNLNDANFEVVAESIEIKDMGECNYQIKFDRQSKTSHEIKRTFFINISFTGDGLKYDVVK